VVKATRISKLERKLDSKYSFVVICDLIVMWRNTRETSILYRGETICGKGMLIQTSMICVGWRMCGDLRLGANQSTLDEFLACGSGSVSFGCYLT
jgi:hypothetical protein